MGGRTVRRKNATARRCDTDCPGFRGGAMRSRGPSVRARGASCCSAALFCRRIPSGGCSVLPCAASRRISRVSTQGPVWAWDIRESAMRMRNLVGGLAGCALLLAGCGGGGDDDGSTQPPPPPPPATYSVGGTVTGLASGATLVLQNNAASNLTVNANGAFTFATKVNSGTAYSVAVSTQPTGQTCAVTNGSGTASANVTNVTVTCTDLPPATFTVGGTVSGLGSGASVVLQNNGGSNLTLNADGAFTFATPVNGGGAYPVSVLTQPTAQSCSVANGSGTVTANVSDVAVTCANTDVTAPTVSSHMPSSTAIGAAVSGEVLTVTFS